MNRREWLNGTWSSFTGSVVAFCGPQVREDGNVLYAFFEVADCHVKARLHSDLVTRNDCDAMVAKMRLLAEVATGLADEIETKVKPTLPETVDPVEHREVPRG